MKLKIAVPSKGRISDPSISILEKAGLGLKDNANRKLISATFNKDIDVMFARASDIPKFVEDEIVDMGITGVDLINESEANVKELVDLSFGQTKLVLASPEDSNINSIDDLTSDMVVATEFPTLTKKYLEEHGLTSKIITLSGSTEIAPLIGIADLHYGLLAKDNLSEEYNMKIAKERFNDIISDVIKRKSNDKSIEKVVLLIGNDFLSADNVQGTTSRHFTQQDQETNWYEIIESATEMLIEEIDKLRFFFPSVEVVNVKGNHDEMSTFGIMQTLNAYYRGHKAITINTSCKFRQYIRYGTSLIGLSHNERVQDVSKIMAAETGTDFGECKYKLFLMGHLHSRKELGDDYGVDIYRLPSVVRS